MVVVSTKEEEEVEEEKEKENKNKKGSVCCNNQVLKCVQQ
jgi:hypothetical protein